VINSTTLNRYLEPQSLSGDFDEQSNYKFGLGNLAWVI
ncbi:unnamed protein product, partial [Acidithrix sp. C25]